MRILILPFFFLFFSPQDFLRAAISHAGALVKEKFKIRRPRTATIVHGDSSSSPPSQPSSPISPRISLDGARRRSTNAARNSIDVSSNIVEVPTVAVVDFENDITMIVQ